MMVNRFREVTMGAAIALREDYDAADLRRIAKGSKDAARIGEETEPATERDEPGANLADGGAIVLAEIGNRLVVGRVEG
jgi:hypothetical protein